MTPDLTWTHNPRWLGRRGEECEQSVCVEYPRLISLRQRHLDEPWIQTYHVEGLAQVYHSVEDALEAIRENPR